MNEITRFSFEGHALEFQKLNGEWWANGDEAAEVLGYADRDAVRRLFARHKAEFLPSEATTVRATAVDGKAREVRVFSPKGLEHLAILGRTATCRRFRRWILDEVLEKLRVDARLVTSDQLEKFAAAIRAESAGQIAALTEIVKSLAAQNVALAGAVNVQASSAGKLLSYIAHSPEARRALDDARDAANGQNRFGWPDVAGPV